jgi:hypothetical protein
VEVVLRLRRFVRWMTRGSTTPSLFVAEDGREWVVKPSGVTFRDGLVEALCSRLGRRFGIPTPPGEVLEASVGLLRAMAVVGGELRALGEAFSRGGGMAFGSLLRPGADWVAPDRPDPREADTLDRIWLFDRWIANADRRPDNPNLILCDGELLAIDHAQALPWLSRGVPQETPHVRHGAGAPAARVRALLDPFADATTVRDAMGVVPAAWATTDELDALAETLAARAVELRSSL